MKRLKKRSVTIGLNLIGDERSQCEMLLKAKKLYEALPLKSRSFLPTLKLANITFLRTQNSIPSLRSRVPAWVSAKDARSWPTLRLRSELAPSFHSRQALGLVLNEAKEQAGLRRLGYD